MSVVKRVVLTFIVALVLAGGSAHAESVCVTLGAQYPAPSGHSVSVDLGPYCVRVP